MLDAMAWLCCFCSCASFSLAFRASKWEGKPFWGAPAPPAPVPVPAGDWARGDTEPRGDPRGEAVGLPPAPTGPVDVRGAGLLLAPPGAPAGRRDMLPERPRGGGTPAPAPAPAPVPAAEPDAWAPLPTPSSSSSSSARRRHRVSAALGAGAAVVVVVPSAVVLGEVGEQRAVGHKPHTSYCYRVSSSTGLRVPHSQPQHPTHGQASHAALLNKHSGATTQAPPILPLPPPFRHMHTQHARCAYQHHQPCCRRGRLSSCCWCRPHTPQPHKLRHHRGRQRLQAGGHRRRRGPRQSEGQARGPPCGT